MMNNNDEEVVVCVENIITFSYYHGVCVSHTTVHTKNHNIYLPDSSTPEPLGELDFDILKKKIHHSNGFR